ncbi:MULTISPECIES: hypothetical protein [unclassified Paraburkholderia]|uniref:hypothetical protein n=1 Tax=unclassified Paraburkholderia TaxID=2615204 RepID=UPI0018340854|nr:MULTISPECIES: hypothetical protein [unclassified Paraburkholderia]MBB5442981.1 hypothetical protein [Paraburkholderia sp. WSM4177]MBB5483414.1 hypothetical protein [Paraburkholderia sp. WSM4180]
MTSLASREGGAASNRENPASKDQARRQAHKQTKADRERKVQLVGEAVLRRVDRGEWDEAEFRRMMDDALSRPADRALFDLD